MTTETLDLSVHLKGMLKKYSGPGETAQLMCLL